MTVTAAHPQSPQQPQQPQHAGPPTLPQIVAEALAAADSEESSDVHIVAGEPPWVRAGGRFARFPETRAVAPAEAAMCYAWAGGDNRSVARVVAGARWRVTSYSAFGHPHVAFRRIPQVPPLLKQLGLPTQVQSLAGLHDGLILAAGPTGSGKTTTLAALISLIVRTRAAHLLTIEDPIEYLYTSERALVTQREIGDALDLDTAMAIAMRSDPDIILLGEIRSDADVRFCLDLAASGHLVFSTIHGTDAGTVCERFEMSAGDSGRSILSQTLRAILVQRLLPDAKDESKRHAAVEMLLMSNPNYRQMIRPGGHLTRIEGELINEHRSMDGALSRLVREGKISREVAESAAQNQRQLAEELQYHADVAAGGGR